MKMFSLRSTQIFPVVLTLAALMVQSMIPKSLRAMKFYFTTVYQEIWVGLALTTYVYYKISYGGKKAVADKSSGAGHH